MCLRRCRTRLNRRQGRDRRDMQRRNPRPRSDRCEDLRRRSSARGYSGVASPVLRGLATETQESALMSVLDGHHLLDPHHIHGHRRQRAVTSRDSLEQLLVVLPQGIANEGALLVPSLNTKQDYKGILLDFNLNVILPPPCTCRQGCVCFGRTDCWARPAARTSRSPRSAPRAGRTDGTC